MLENKEYCQICKTFVEPDGYYDATGINDICPECGSEIEPLPLLLDKLYREQYIGAKVQAMLNHRFEQGTLTKAHLVFWAEKLIDSERYSQYQGHWSSDAWKIKQIPRNITTKLGEAFKRGDVTLVNTTGCVSVFWHTGFSFRNSCDTAF